MIVPNDGYRTNLGQIRTLAPTVGTTTPLQLPLPSIGGLVTIHQISLTLLRSRGQAQFKLELSKWAGTCEPTRLTTGSDQVGLKFFYKFQYRLTFYPAHPV